LEKFRGGMLGGALGDAVGALAASHGDYASLIDWIGEGDILRYTDDTAMLIGIAEALTKSGGGINEEEIGKIFQRNYVREPWRDYSQSLTAIFATVKRHDVPFSEAASRLHDGKGSPGSGAAMRNAPVGLLFRNSARLRELPRKRHGSPIHTKLGSTAPPLWPGLLRSSPTLTQKRSFRSLRFAPGLSSLHKPR